MARRLALLVGNSQFKDMGNFPNLHTPCQDARDLASVLQQYGRFEILDLLLDAGAEQVRLAVENLYAQAQRGDLTLFYYSGHGYKDIAGRLFLAAADTQIINHKVTRGVSETFIQEGMSTSDSRHRVIILDCCFSGAFIGGEKAAASEMLVLEKMKGEATAILASSGRIQYSFEEQGCNSLFTRYFLEGVTTGEADEDGDGTISVNELFDYTDLRVRHERPEQTPVIELSTREGQLVIAETPPGRMKAIRKQHQLDSLYREARQAVDEKRWSEALALLKEIENLQPNYADTAVLREQVETEIERLEQNTDLASALRALLTNPLPAARLGAIYELEKLLSSHFPRLVQLALEELQHLSADDSRRVSEAAHSVLERHTNLLVSKPPVSSSPQKIQDVPFRGSEAVAVDSLVESGGTHLETAHPQEIPAGEQVHPPIIPEEPAQPVPEPSKTPPSQVPTLQSSPPIDITDRDNPRHLSIQEDFISTQVKPIIVETFRKISSSSIQWSSRGHKNSVEKNNSFMNRYFPWMALGFAVVVLIGLFIWGAMWRIGNKPIIPSIAMSGVSVDLYFTSNRDGNNDIYRLDGDGKTTRVTNSPQGAESAEPALASDGVLYFGSSRAAGNMWEVFRMDTDGKTQRVTNSPSGSVSWGAIPIRGGELYFGSNRYGKTEIYNMNGEGKIIRITNSPENSGSWGHAISRFGDLYFTSNRDLKNEIYCMGKDGKTFRVTNTKNGQSWRPSPTPDGSIYFTSNRSGKSEIYKLDTSGKITQVTYSPSTYESWTPVIIQNGAIYFTSNRGGKIEIYFLDDSGKITQLTHSSGNTESWLSKNPTDG